MTGRLRWHKSRMRGDKAIRLQWGRNLIGWVRPHALGWEWKVRMGGMEAGGVVHEYANAMNAAKDCAKANVTRLKALAEKKNDAAVDGSVSPG